ncbi:Quinoprotein dehydrogenase-associated SoxYZ-like carrier [Rubrivivax sp. A210]|uniref:quinoprotein dehydrogenase-associated SoxYZ-like carrier n=1 Tax=Rubrivivax sp. A210 TaxID=2772301 RepID=UPI0019C30D64|nr:quinoprotein dehydrogenase-associated SoxYZ-like carrier [Rubrivivax sp. A210]CAD5372145.1 Quinoprotein dehydrogenase-associated SoxYZ-like carrier [Rubrivivax sp. A210]
MDTRYPSLARRSLLLAPVMSTILAAFAGTAAAQLKTGDNPEASENWRKVRASLYAGREIRSAPEALLTLDLPARAEDAAVVPLAIRTGGTAAQRIKRLTLIIDNNPSPIAAIFDFGRDSARADIETRVRIDEYTHVRAVAEMDSGELLMAVRFVKASGGCSAPPGKDPQAALASLGRMRLRVDGAVRREQPVLAQVMISHPNASGLAMDQATRQYTPAHYVRQLVVSYAGEPVVTADLDISISENPNFRFYFVPRGDGVLKAEVMDSRELRFESGIALVAAP